MVSGFGMLKRWQLYSSREFCVGEGVGRIMHQYPHIHIYIMYSKHTSRMHVDQSFSGDSMSWEQSWPGGVRQWTGMWWSVLISFTRLPGREWEECLSRWESCTVDIRVEPSRPENILIYISQGKRLMQGGLVNSSWCNTCKTMLDNNRCL